MVEGFIAHIKVATAKEEIYEVNIVDIHTYVHGVQYCKVQYYVPKDPYEISKGPYWKQFYIGP
jgi:hypothetical protein